MAKSFGKMWLGMIRVMRVGAKLVEDAYPDVLRVIQGADLVITSDTGSGIAESEKAGVPWISVTLQPGRIPAPNPNPTLIDKIVWPVLGKLFISPTNSFRRRVGAPPAKDITDLMSRRLILLPVSRYVAAPNPHWPAHVCSTGYWFAQDDPAFSPPPGLLDFLESGERPVVVSLGVMSSSGKQAREGAQIILSAIQNAGVRAVIQGWDTALQGQSIPATVYHAGSLPHGWLFSQAGAVIHHGGFGTTAAALRSGAPSIVIPHVIDQFYWGQRVFELGVGPKFIPRNKLTTAALSEAIRQAVQDEKVRSRAAVLGQQIRSEPDGAEIAVRIIEDLA